MDTKFGGQAVTLGGFVDVALKICDFHVGCHACYHLLDGGGHEEYFESIYSSFLAYKDLAGLEGTRAIAFSLASVVTAAVTRAVQSLRFRSLMSRILRHLSRMGAIGRSYVLSFKYQADLDTKTK